MKRISKLLGISELRSLQSKTALAEENKSAEELLMNGIEHFNNLRKQECVLTFEVLIDMYPNNVRGRVVFSSIYEKYGELGDAVKVLEEGLIKIERDEEGEPKFNEKEKKMQFVLQIEMGKLFLRLSKKFSKVSHLFEKGWTDKNVIEKAMIHFESAQVLGPKKIIAIEMQAECLERLDRHEEACELWQKLKQSKRRYLKRYASSLEFMGDHQQSMKVFSEIAEGGGEREDTGFAFEKLAFYNKDKQQKIELQLKAEFFQWVPRYCVDLQFSAENYEIYKALTMKNKQNTLDKSIKKLTQKNIQIQSHWDIFETKFNELLEMKDMTSSSFLVSILHNHIAGTFVNKALQELFTRSEGKEVQDLLFTMIQQPDVSSSVIKNVIWILSKRQHPRIYNTIITHLQNDMGLVHKGIPMALGEIGNKDAVPHLIKVVNLKFEKKHKNTASGIGSIGHLRLRQRACLALGFFKDVRGLKACRQGRKIPELRLYCDAALYKMSDDPRWLKDFFKLTREKKLYVGYEIYVYLKTLCKGEKVDTITQEIAEMYEKRRQEEWKTKICQ